MIRWLILKFYDWLPDELQFAIGLRFVNKFSDAYMRMEQVRGRTAELYFHRAQRARANGKHPEHQR